MDSRGFPTNARQFQDRLLLKEYIYFDDAQYLNITMDPPPLQNIVYRCEHPFQEKGDVFSQQFVFFYRDELEGSKLRFVRNYFVRHLWLK